MNKYDWDLTNEQTASVVERAADTVTRVKTQAGNAIRGSFYVVCLVAIILLEVLRRFVTGGLNEAFSLELVFAGLVTSLTTLLTFYLFFPSGKGVGSRTKPFLEAQELMERAVTAINAGLKIAFRAWCKSRAEREAEEEREAAFDTLANLYITREDFEERWRLASRWKLGRAVRRGEITQEAKKQILRCRRPIAVEPYVPEHFLAGVNAKKQKRMLHGDNGYEVWVLVQKPLTVMLIAVAQSGFTMAFHGVENSFDVFLAIVMSIFQICLSAFSGFLAGQKIAEHRTAVNLVKAGFMMEFLEEQRQTDAETAENNGTIKATA